MSRRMLVTDTLCQAPPALSSKSGDVSPLTFDPNDTWTYTCSVQTQEGQTQSQSRDEVQSQSGAGAVPGRNE